MSTTCLCLNLTAVPFECVHGITSKWKATAEGFGVDEEEVIIMTSILQSQLRVSEATMQDYAKQLFAAFDIEKVTVFRVRFACPRVDSGTNLLPPRCTTLPACRTLSLTR